MDYKKIVQDRIDEVLSELTDLSDYIWANPEYCFKEYKACAAMSEVLRKHGFEVETGVADLETAVKAVYDSGKSGPNFGFVGEFDAVPGMGHSCGHNIMCAIPVGAAIGLKAVIDDLGGKITVLGTPAEEGGGGKIIMLDKGAFDGLDIALLIHSCSDTCVNDISYSRTDVLVHFYGKRSHAATWPDEGISALTPILTLFNTLNSMRLEMADRGKIIGVIRDGGQEPIMIPEHCSAEFTVRSFSMKTKWALFNHLIKMCENIAEMTNTRFEYEMVDLSYEDIRNNPVIEDALAKNFEALGEEIKPRLKEQGIGCTDMGNITHAVPGLQSYVRVVPDLRGHTKEFEDACGTKAGHHAVEVAAKAEAMTAVDILTTPGLLEEIRKAFKEMKEKYE